MVYGDLQFFDIIVFAAVAAFLIYRLRNVLGKRSGFEPNNKQKKLNNSVEEKKEKTIPQLKENEQKFLAVYEAIDDFDHKHFLEGAKFAFETIINAFNKGDNKTLKNLLTEDVFSSFETAINEEKNNPGFQFYSLVVSGVEKTEISEENVNITLKITSEQFKDGDESTVIKKQDLWTFQKSIKSKSPIWLLSAT